MYVLLPKKRNGLASLETKISYKPVTSAMVKLQKQTIVVRFPKFKMTRRMKLKKILMTMGSFSFSQILDGALCRAFKIQREFVSSLQVTHLPPVWGILLPLA